MNGSIFVVKEDTRKRCAICNVKIEQGQSVFSFIKSSFGGKDNVRWEHFKCVLLEADSLITPQQYAEIFKEWTLNRL